MKDRYDGIILGAGHNGLIAQAYLCKAGLSVLSVDRNDYAGGGLVTKEYPEHPGFRHNTHAFFCRAANSYAWYHDLELERHGAEMIEPEMNVAVMTKEGDALQWWTDFERTYESVGRFSEKDAATLKRWYEEFVPIVGDILRPEMAAPPIHPEERRRLLEKSPEGRRLLEVSALSPLEFVRTEFESPVVQAGLIFFNGLREVDMRVKGFGHHIAMLLASPAKAQMVKGGSQRLGEAIASSVREAGGDILLDSPLARILVEDGRAVGIETEDGDVIRADRFVASSLNPRQTFLELIEPDHLPRAWREKAFGFEFNMVAPLATVHLGLSEPPRYAAADKLPSVEDAFMVIMGIDDLTTFERMFERHETGNMPPGPILYGASPTKFDPTQAPVGKHTAFMWQKVPYKLYGDPDNWDRQIDTVGRDMLAQWTRYAPNLADAVEYSFFQSPRDIVRSLPNLGEGDPLGGAYSNGQYLYNRPFEGAGQYRTCLEGLYLCGSSTHPGGNITGFPGFNAAGVIAADLDLGVDWIPPSLAERLEGLAARAAE